MPSGITVVEIEIPDHRCVDESHSFGGQSLPETQNAAGILIRNLTGCQPSADLRRLTVVGPESTSEGIDQTLCGSVHALFG
jgi:hypothetical protein